MFVFVVFIIYFQTLNFLGFPKNLYVLKNNSIIGDYLRHRDGHSSLGLILGRFLISELLNSSFESKWRVGNEIKRCTLCGRCQVVCPVNAISVNVKNKSWTLNNRRCGHCLNCIVKCPVSCLSRVNL